MFFNKQENPAEAKEVDVELTKATAALPKAKVEEELQDFVEEAEGQLAVDVYQTPTEIVIQSTVAGVDPENLDIAITNESVTIRGRRERFERVKDEDYFYQECYWGRFARSIILPQEVDPEKAVASLKNGVLSIHLPKLNREKIKKLRVKLD
jgi:HSP20 family protein